MAIQTSARETIDALKAIFHKHKEERVYLDISDDRGNVF